MYKVGIWNRYSLVTKSKILQRSFQICATHKYAKTNQISRKGSVTIRGETFEKDDFFNISNSILALVERGGMHNDQFHPIGLLSRCINQHFAFTY